MSEEPLAVNHHADHPGFAGVTGTLFAWAFLLIGHETGRLAAELTDVGPADVVVDIGCGAGNAVRAAARRPVIARPARRSRRPSPGRTRRRSSAGPPHPGRSGRPPR